MRNKLFLFAFTALFTNAFSQQGPKWATGGNLISNDDFIGTTNNFPMDFRINNTQRMKLGIDGNLVLNNLAGSGNRMLMSDSTGKLFSLPAGGPGQFLQGNGVWGNLPGGATSWQLIGNDLISTNSGNIGIGTSNPQNKLEVVGDVSISNNLFVGGGLITSQQVDATTMLNAGDVNATNNLNVSGNSNFSGLMTSQPLGNNNGYQPIFVNSGGQFVTATAQGPIGGIFPSTACYPLNPPWVIGGNALIGTGLTDPSVGTCDDVQFGIKQNNQNRVYFGNASNFYNIGFGTTNPQQKYHFSSGHVLIDELNSSAGTQNTKLNIRGAVDNTGLMVTTNHNLNGAYNVKLFVNRNETKAIGVLNTFADPNGFENFIVYGDGKTNVGWQPNSQNLAKLNVNLNGGPALNIYDAITNQINFAVNADGATFIGNPSQTNGAMLTVAQANDNALAFSITDNSFNPNRDFFNVLGNGYTEIKVYSPLAMPNGRAFAIKDMVANRDIFVVKSDGKAYAREVEITLVQNFPDYVFRKDYKLKTLNEVETFINENKHHPNFKKADYYEKNGMNITNIILDQQKTIEELTLYGINADKKVQNLEKRIEALENYIKSK
ncbi:MAG: hypothetical protein IPM51_00365 [Sphingobacteriaceae bacterium]|nr:hypothetical protein [Sphingobacteriaceae bacterium]